MGYSSLDSWTGSDKAADLMSEAFDALVEVLNNGLDEESNEYNTEGCVNVALILEDIFLKSDTSCSPSSKMDELLDKTIKAMENEIAESKKFEWYDKENKNYHLKSFNRILKNLNKIKTRWTE